MATVVTITANPLLDWLAEAELRPGAVSRTGGFRAVAGGKGLNVARVLARHGHRVIACSFAGGDSSRQLADLIAADGPEPDLAPTAARTRIGFQAIQGGSATALIEGGFAVSAAECGQLVERVRRWLPLADLVIASGSVPDPSCDGLYRVLADSCAHAGRPFWLDAYGPACLAALRGAHPPALVKPNREEYGAQGGEPGSPWLLAPEQHLSDGAAQVVVRTPQGRFRVTPPAITQANPIGSGDCYLAGLAHARLSGLPLPAQLAYAAAAGAANAARPDVARIGPEDIAALVGRVQVAVQP